MTCRIGAVSEAASLSTLIGRRSGPLAFLGFRFISRFLTLLVVITRLSIPSIRGQVITGIAVRFLLVNTDSSWLLSTSAFFTLSVMSLCPTFSSGIATVSFFCALM